MDKHLKDGGPVFPLLTSGRDVEGKLVQQSVGGIRMIEHVTIEMMKSIRADANYLPTRIDSDWRKIMAREARLLAEAVIEELASL